MNKVGTLLVLLLLACAATLTASAAAVDRHAPAASRSVSAAPFVGTWRRVTRCGELVAALRNARMQKWVLEFVAGNGFIPGVTSPDQIADPSHPCNGAVPRRHAHFFRKNGEFGSLDWRGQPVDDGKYTVVDGRTFVISKEFPKVRFHYSIRGRDIRFAPVVSKGCLTFRCAWAISMAYPGKTWHRSAPAFASTGEAKLRAPAGRRPPPLDQWLPTGWKKFSTM